MTSLHSSSSDDQTEANTQITCVMTRFEVRSLGGLLRLHRSFRRVRANSKDLPGLITCVFLLENLHTCYTVSFWQDEAAIIRFNNRSLEHIKAGNRCFRYLRRSNGSASLWSAQFRLSSLSGCNTNWLRGSWTRSRVNVGKASV